MHKLYGLKVSYFTGKMEGYLRYKEIPHEFCSMTVGQFTKTIPAVTGAMQMPAVELSDGRWMTDTSPMIDWFEAEYPNHPILPEDPVQAYFCRLIEDYADEWLWRPAMHYRWSYPVSSKLLARQIVDEISKDVPAPAWLKRARTEKRQYTNFVKRDGVRAETLENVESGYLKMLGLLSAIFEKRPFLFGDRPTLADIGLFGPFFRHFSMDPKPAVIMRETAPLVMKWVYSLWNARGSNFVETPLDDGVPEDVLPIIREVGETHLQSLCANAVAWQKGQSHYDVDIQDAPYRNLPVSQYRVWCLGKLQERYNRLDLTAKSVVTSILEEQGALEPLLRVNEPGSEYDVEGKAPFGGAIPVFKDVRG